MEIQPRTFIELSAPTEDAEGDRIEKEERVLLVLVGKLREQSVWLQNDIVGDFGAIVT